MRTFSPSNCDLSVLSFIHFDVIDVNDWLVIYTKELDCKCDRLVSLARFYHEGRCDIIHHSVNFI